ncbi:site-specific DNA-methyltransferase [Deinococcus sp. Arct2-2]|uniref:site-specific DNA-methyltransferase n=1 Tax=Deinococcus sp. Arct2-2 TaxID=2568653 RepID=UPI0010A44ED6|nr:site-specific DNA-methyltransferase [Deinococcus sp. Arct2-2]THF71321.1 site-specific DNA-methyltransferase [Deinococcus sp. Arct2-2]
MTTLHTKYDHLTREDLVALLVQRDTERHFGLVWERDAAEHEQALSADVVALDLDESLSVGDGAYRNLIIEGDNFDALRSLNLTHRGHIKCIYIDPPYNTGGQEFVYNDRYNDKEDRFRHSTWLEFMFRRLQLAKELMTPDGVLLVSIDDNAVAPLTLLLDQLFPGGKVGTFVWRRRSGSNDVPDTFVSVDHEYVLCYALPGFSFAGTDKALADYKDFDPGNPDPWKRGDLSKPHTLRARPNGFYPVYHAAEDIWYPPNPKRVWAFASAGTMKEGQKLRRGTMEDLLAEGRVVFPKKDDPVVYATLEALREAVQAGTAPRYLQLGLFETPEEEERYLSFYIGKRLGFGTPGYKRFRSEVKTTSKPISTWLSGLKDKVDKGDEEHVTVSRTGLNADGGTLLGQMFQNTTLEFSYPKPLSLLQTLVAQATGPDDIVLDFFAGSGTTGHAVLSLNAADELSDRRFILVSSTEATPKTPLKNICRDVTRERLQRAIAGYTYRGRSGNVAVEGLGGDFAYLKTRQIPNDQAPQEIQHSQVWGALQLIHTHTLERFLEHRPVQCLQTDALLLLYLTEIDGESLAEIQRLAAADDGPVVVYSWQPLLVEQYVEQHGRPKNLTVKTIPDNVRDWFGKRD